MENQFYDISLLDKYLEGTISPEELTKLKKQFETPEAFEQEVKLQQLLIEGIRSEGNRSVVKKIMPDIQEMLDKEGFFENITKTEQKRGGISGLLGEIDAELEQEGYYDKVKQEVDVKQAKVRPLVLTWAKRAASAAAAILLVVIGISAIPDKADKALSSNFVKTEQFADKAAKAIKVDESGHAGEPIPAQKKILKAGIQAFQEKNFPLAISYLDGFYGKYQDYEKGAYYLALSHLHHKKWFNFSKKNYKRANELLSLDIYEEYQNEVKWFKALCFLKLNEQKKALDLLREVKNENTVYAKEASELIKAHN